jgi:hypothetical protein
MLPGALQEGREKTRANCEEYGVEAARARLNAGLYAGRKEIWVREWIEERDAALAAKEKEVDRGISRDANRIAKRASWFAAGALAVSILALAVAAYAALRQFPI